MAEGYKELATKVHGEESDSPVIIAEVDATEQKKIASEFKVEGFPSLKFFKDGVPIDYQGAREKDPIYNWIQKKIGPSSKLLSTQEEVDNIAKQSLACVYYLPESDSEALNKYMAFTAAYDEIQFTHVNNKDLLGELAVTEDYSFIVVRDFDEGNKILGASSGIETDAMKTFFEDNRYPYVSEFNQDAANRIFGSQKTSLILMTDEIDSEVIKTFKEFGKNNQNEYIYSVSAITSGFGARLAEYIGVKKENDPSARFISFEGGSLNKYIVKDLSAEGLVQALADFKADKLTAHFKSGPIPETNDEPVKVIVGDTFEELVLTKDKYVLLEAYAPWCGHCKKLEPIYNELAEKLSKEQDVVIAKMDATENEHKLMAVQGFPTLRLFKPGSDTPVDYSGDRSLKDLVKFMETNLDRTFSEIKSDEL